MKNFTFISMFTAAMLLLSSSLSAQSALQQAAKRAQNRVEQSVNTKVRMTESKAKIAVREGARTAGRNAVQDAKSKIKGLAGAGKEFYVSANTGSNRNDGSIDAPFKNIAKALEVAPMNATIIVAEGNYYGVLGKGNINIEKSITIIGGFSDDFSERDVLKYRTMVQPNAASNGTLNGMGTIQILAKDGGSVNIDGLIFDRGYSTAYNMRGEGQPEGVETPMMCPIGTKGKGGPDLTEEVLTAETAEIYLGTPQCDINIANCAFVNAPNYCIRGTFTGDAVIENCIFVNARMSALEMRGGSAQRHSNIDFVNNTVLFTWSRLRDLGDMGYGVRYLPGTNLNVENCIIGCSIFTGLDHTHIDSNASKEASRNDKAVNNLFFLNKQGDLAIPGGGMFMRVKAEDFEEVEQLKVVSGNKTLKDASVFKGIIDEAYLNGFMNVAYTESTDFNPNSAANTFRSAMGMNMVGTMQSSTTMFMNRYNIEKALNLFGAVDGYGAQDIIN